MEKATLALLLFLLSSSTVGAKSTIEPCSGAESCPALLGYKLYADLKVSEVAALFQTDLPALLAANAIDASLPGVEHSILPAGLFLRVPAACACSGGIRRSVSTGYTVRPADTLASIAASVFAGLASAEQIRDANGIQDPAALDPGRTLLIPLPCTCFNSTDNFLPAVYLSYVVRAADTLPAIAVRYSTTVTDLMNVNAMGSPSVLAGDILAVPLPACPSMFPSYASDYGLIVANGTYTITASHCVQCSCGPGNLNLYCSPASLSASCSSMQCSNSNLMIGNFTSQQTSAGCNITSCNYAGFVNGSIVTKLTTSLQPQCPGDGFSSNHSLNTLNSDLKFHTGQHQFPPVIAPPTMVVHESLVAPSLSPVQTGGGALLAPKTSVPGTLALPGASAASSPAGSASQAVCVLPLSYISAVAFPLVVLAWFL